MILAFVGGDPVRAYVHIVDAAFGDIGVLRDTLVKATPLILTGLACALAFRMRLWNIGAEGQFLLGAWGAGAVVLAPILPAGTPGHRRHPRDDGRRRAGGGAVGLHPGRPQGALGVNEIITTLMLNYIALAVAQFWVFGPWSEGGFQQTAPFPREAWLPRLTDFAEQFPVLAGLTTHLGLVFALIATAIMSVVVSRTRWGYEIRLIGDNPRAARYAGIDIAQVRHRGLHDLGRPGRPGRDERGRAAWSTACRPHLAGLRLHGDHHRVPRPVRTVGVVVASILFGALILAGREIQPSGVPGDDPGHHPVLPHRSDVLLRYRVRFGRPATAAAGT